MNTVDATLPFFRIDATAIRVLTVGGPLDNRTVRFCPNCNLVYQPDPRIYKEPDLYCPQCNHKLIKD